LKIPQAGRDKILDQVGSVRRRARMAPMGAGGRWLIPAVTAPGRVGGRRSAVF
jgi:hypothetical protein